MIFICALLPICNLAAVLAYGGSCAALSVILSFLLLPLLARLKSGSALFLPLLVFSVALRLCAVFAESLSALGWVRSLAVVLACVAAAAFAAYNGDSVFHTPTPIFFITALLALYISVVAAESTEFYSLSRPSAVETASSIVCPLSSCIAFSGLTQYPPQKRIKGGLCGVLVCAVFLLFKSASAELGFISVPLAISASAQEIKAIVGIIVKARE